MRRFVRNFVLFAAPFLVVLGLPTFVLLGSGELTTVRAALALQAIDHRLLFGTAYSYPAKPYKLAALDRRKIDVLALGTSRVMQFRAEQFAVPSAFYNAGGLVSTPGDWETLARRLPSDVRPRLVILSVDPWFWNATWTERNADAPAEMLADTNVLNGIQQDWLTVWRDLRSGKVPLSSILHGRGIGIGARVRGAGFRYDGSYDYGWIGGHLESPDHWDHDFSSTMGRIARRAEGFEDAEHPSSRALPALRALLDELSRRGAIVVGFIPPFAPTIHQRLLDDRAYAYMRELREQIAPVFAAHGDVLVDFGFDNPLDASDRDFVDGYHGSELVYARILRRISAIDARVEPFLAMH